MLLYNSLSTYMHICILVMFIYETHGNGSYLNGRSLDYGVPRTADSNKLVKSEDRTSENSGLVEHNAAVRSVGEVFVPKTFPLSSQEPTCEQLRAMWIFSKRQSRAAEITNEIPTYRDPFTYNVWEPLFTNPRLLGSIRMGARERARSPVFGRIVSREPIIPQRMTYESRQVHVDDGIASSLTNPSQNRLFGAETRQITGSTAGSPRRSTSQNRYVGVSSTSPNVANVQGGGNQNSVAVQGSFQKLKELIWTERAKELTQQRRAEELAARAAVLKDIANGQNIQASYKQQPLGSSQGDSILMDENRSPDSSRNPYNVKNDRISIANIQNMESNYNKNRLNGNGRATTRRIGSAAHETVAVNIKPQRKETYFSSGNAKESARVRIPAATEINADDLNDKDYQAVIGIAKTYPNRQSHFRERNRSLLKQFSPIDYFQRNTRILQDLQLGSQTKLSKSRSNFNKHFLTPPQTQQSQQIGYGRPQQASAKDLFQNLNMDLTDLTVADITPLLYVVPQEQKSNQYGYDFYNNAEY